MKRTLLLILLSVLSVSTVFSKERKTVIVIMDGVSMDVIERLHVPVIYDIASKGGFAANYVGGQPGTYTETPTISAVGYNTMLTGTWANKHNVFGNSNLKPNYNYWSIFRIAKEQQSPVSTAVFTGWTDNRTVLLGHKKEENASMDIDYIYDGYDKDKERFPKKEYHLEVSDFDEAVSEDAAKCIREDAPDLSWVYFWFTDSAGHQFGDGEFFDEHVLKTGKQIEKVWEAVKYREKNFDEEWLIVVLTDHGRTMNGRSHGRQSDRERSSWIAMNRKPNAYFKSGAAAMVDVNPTVCEYMGFEVPLEVRREQDGISLIGKTEIRDLRLSQYDKKVILRWKAESKSAPVKIYVAKANDYKTTGSEYWTLLGEVKAGEERFEADLNSIGESDFYKFVVEGEHDTLNRWFKN